MLKHLEFVFDFDTWRHYFAIGNKCTIGLAQLEVLVLILYQREVIFLILSNSPANFPRLWLTFAKEFLSWIFVSGSNLLISDNAIIESIKLNI